MSDYRIMVRRVGPASTGFYEDVYPADGFDVQTTLPSLEFALQIKAYLKMRHPNFTFAVRKT